MDNRKQKAQHRASRAAQKAVEDPSDTPKREMEVIDIGRDRKGHIRKFKNVPVSEWENDAA
jgi:hypothetical protein